MDAHHVVAHPRASFATLVPTKHNAYTFGHGSGAKISKQRAAAISAFAEKRGAAFIQQGSDYFFAVHRMIADATPDYAGALCTDLANAQLLGLDAYHPAG